MRNGHITIEARCAELMKAHGTVRATAKVVGMTPSYFWRLANGKKSAPSADILARLGLQQNPPTYTRIPK